VRYDPATGNYVPVDWDEAFALIGRELNALDDPNEAEFYTSGRTSGGVRISCSCVGGTNNFPTVRTCAEPTSVGLPESIGIGKERCCSTTSHMPRRSSSSARTRAPTADADRVAGVAP
jgi:formate dehydrogenase major subunit